MSVEVSVIIPVYNCEEYLDVCLTSVLMQTFPDFEIICIDDCSTDNSPYILKRYAQNDERVVILTNSANSGSGYSRNRALDIARGKYIFFLDSDDWLVKETLEMLYNQCENNNLDLVMFKSIVFYNENYNFDYEKYYDMNFMDGYEGKIFNHSDLKPEDVFNLPVGPCNKLYKKSLLDENNIRFPNQHLIQQDNPFFFKVITSAQRVSTMNKYFYNRRRRPGSVMSSLGDKRLFSRLVVADLLVKYFLTDVELYNRYKKYLLQRVSRHLTNDAYRMIRDEYKQEMFDAIHDLYIKFMVDYNLKEDILEYVDKSLLIKYGVIKE